MRTSYAATLAHNFNLPSRAAVFEYQQEVAGRPAIRRQQALEIER
jgi:hypothetical protein